MIFTTPEFVLFFALFLWAHSALKGRARKYLLLAASYAFYASWDAWFLLLIIGSTLLDFHVGRRLHAATDARQRKRLVLLSLAGNLGALGFFKYFDFFVSSAAEGLAALGLDVSPPLLEVLLPVGISFYTFQTLSYTIDIYRGELEPTDSLLDFALFVAFFPQLVAGPIERAKHLLPQIAALGRLSEHPKASGWGLIALGAFKKAAIADNMAPLVDATYADPSAVFAPAMWIGTYAFALQIYCDFSGYSDIAVGLGRLLGLDIVQNFRSPYAAAGPSEFWRRWHISLSTWLRDYLYIPLGGNRGGWFYVRRNLLLTMVLGGLWHGAAWNFVLWGVFHGLLLVVFRARWLRWIADRLDARIWSKIPAHMVRRLVFFHLVCFGWALFRAESLADCQVVWTKLLSVDLDQWSAWWEGPAQLSGQVHVLTLAALAFLGLVGAQNLWPVGSKRVVAALWSTPPALRFLTVALLFYFSALLAPERPPPFIYFQF